MREFKEFDFENLEVYQKAIEFTDMIFTKTGQLPTQLQFSLGDQFRRASLSICNNIAEGSNKSSVKEKTRYYETAIHSARECIPCLTIYHKQNLITDAEHLGLRNQCLVICRMLNGLIKAVNRKNQFSKSFVALLLFFIPLSTFHIPHLHAAFKENVWPARASAMGGAFGAVSNDASAMLFNPAGLSQIERKEANFGYAQKFMGLPNVTVGNMSAMFGYPVEKIGAFGVYYLSSDASSLYVEQTVALSYSAPIHKMMGTKTVKVGKRSMEFPKMSLPVYAGLNLKMISIKYNTAGDPRAALDPVFRESQGAGGLAADIGFLVRPADKLSTSLVVKNLVSPNLAIGKDSDRNMASEPAPMEVGIGAAYRFGDFGAFEDFVAALDIASRSPKDAAAETNWRLGAESWFAYHKYAVRAGFNNTEFALGGGLLHNLGSVEVQMDYSFALPLSVSDNSGHHRLSVTTRF